MRADYKILQAKEEANKLKQQELAAQERQRVKDFEDYLVLAKFNP